VITDPSAAVVLCFGDSNTYGASSDTDGPDRLPADVRWTGQLQQLLGTDFSVVEEGLNGRTTDVDYPDRPGCNGLPYFLPCLLSHAPLDVVVVMLGTNDLKSQFGRSAESIAAAVGRYVDVVEAVAVDRGEPPPTLVLVSPVHVDDRRPAYVEQNGDDFDSTAAERSRQLGTLIRRVAEQRGVRFADAAEVATVGDDGIHLDVDSHGRLARLVARAVSEDAVSASAD
jgi:lysophospholipase L1-like esterase